MRSTCSTGGLRSHHSPAIVAEQPWLVRKAFASQVQMQSNSAATLKSPYVGMGRPGKRN